MIPMRLPIIHQTRNRQEIGYCRQNCDACQNPCDKRGRYSRQGLPKGHLEIPHLAPPGGESIREESHTVKGPLSV